MDMEIQTPETRPCQRHKIIRPLCCHPVATGRECSLECSHIQTHPGIVVRGGRVLHPTIAAAVAPTYVNRKLRASTPSCTKADISITQGKSGNSNGIPAFSVQITNLCVNHNCQLRNIHVACAAFASARPLDSRVFQRIKYNDCLVMGGAPLRAGGSVAFEYANSSEYPMHVISADLGPCS